MEQVLTQDNVDDDNDGYSENQGDCDDTDSTVYPGATEVCDGLDNDCNGQIDEGVCNAVVPDVVGLSQSVQILP